MAANDLLDPDLVFDPLPQPYRMLNKLLNWLIDHACDVAVQNAATKRKKVAVKGL